MGRGAVDANAETARTFRINMVAEYQRQRVPMAAFQVVKNSTASQNLCETYPEDVLVPVTVPSDAVMACASAWVDGRLPVLSYWRQAGAGGDGGSGLFRCSHSKAGAAQRVEGRQQLLEAIRDISKHAVAAEAAAAAAAAAAGGGGGAAAGVESSGGDSLLPAPLTPRTEKRRAEASAMYPEAVVESRLGEIGRLLIADCRSSVAAVGQALTDARSTAAPILGEEHMQIDIANHHAMRASIDSLRKLVHDERESTTLGGTTTRDSVSPLLGISGAGCHAAGSAPEMSAGESAASWMQELATTQWLAHLAILLDGAVRVAWAWLARGGSLLVQCATGRDRSAQLSALIQLLLEPRFRSKAGFANLVQKEFGAFGFSFSMRFGTAAEPTERSPIFLQFLDAVHQLRRQRPESFEFTEAFLVDLATFSGSEWWSDFLFDDERTRVQQDLGSRCPSVWERMLAPNAASAQGESYTQPFYSNEAEAAAPDDGGRGGGDAVPTRMLEVRAGARHLVFWSSLFLRYDADSLRAAEMSAGVSPAAATAAVASATMALGDSSAGGSAASAASSGTGGGGGSGPKVVKWHPHAPGRALVEGGVELLSLPPELVNDTVLYKFELRVGLTVAGVLQTRYSTARAAHQDLSKQGVLDSFQG
jgi:hypothetical protein